MSLYRAQATDEFGHLHTLRVDVDLATMTVPFIGCSVMEYELAKIAEKLEGVLSVNSVELLPDSNAF